MLRVAMATMLTVTYMSVAQAEPLPEYFRSARAMGMGGAYIAIADDQDALFLNPAGLAGQDKARFNLVNADATISSDSFIYARNSLAGFGDFGPDTINALMGQNHFGQGQAGASLVMPNFGLGYLFNGEFGVQAQNQALPNFTLINIQTHVIQGGAAIGFGRKRRGKWEFRIGVGGKAVMRRGGYRAIQYADIPLLSVSYLDQIVGPNAWSFGFDLGTQLIVRLGKQWTLMAGSAFTNFGDIAFSGDQMPLYGDLGVGFAARYDVKKFHIILAADLKHLTDDTDWRKKMHFGMEAGLSWINLLVGFNQVYPTFGLSLDVWLMRFIFSSYAVENGSQAFQDTERRWMFNTMFKLPL